ncbi:MAG: Hsp20/alpha crystallin family protein [Rugosibacter sp.]|nr:MAG: Hsp20/alpha crystallin family protein [Rugosibacter sp.]TBR10031.1 MAG: Hsp20/alpha crystallin family protein [Rugosibacter sp.]
MANITRFNPFNELARLDPFADVGDFFNGFTLRPVLRNFEIEPQIKLEVSEEDKVYRVKAEIPGVKKEDINVTVDGKQVSISAEVKKEKEEKEGEKVIRSERYYGKVSRSFSLDQAVDESATQAKYTDGVLEMTLPKKSGTITKKITVA